MKPKSKPNWASVERRLLEKYPAIQSHEYGIDVNRYFRRKRNLITEQQFSIIYLNSSVDVLWRPGRYIDLETAQYAVSSIEEIKCELRRYV